MNLKKILFNFVPICIIVFCIFYYIFLKTGNNKTKEEIVDEVLNSFYVYEANIEVTVNSNKIVNNYKMFQMVNHRISKCIVYEPEDIKGLTIELNEGKLSIKNEEYSMEKIYENYNDILNNSLFLNTFVNDCKTTNPKIQYSNDEIIIETEILNNKNTYIKYKELYVDLNSKIPKKLIIKDDTKNIYTSIIYNNIKIK